MAKLQDTPFFKRSMERQQEVREKFAEDPHKLTVEDMGHLPKDMIEDLSVFTEEQQKAYQDMKARLAKKNPSLLDRGKLFTNPAQKLTLKPNFKPPKMMPPEIRSPDPPKYEDTFFHDLAEHLIASQKRQFLWLKVEVGFAIAIPIVIFIIEKFF